MRNRIGVCFNKRMNKWQASIRVDGSRIHLGSFENRQEAIFAREVAESKFQICRTYLAGHRPNREDWIYLFQYDYSSGRLINRVSRNNGALRGTFADKVCGSYSIVTFLGKHYRSHRIIWEIVHEEIPHGFEIDHINRNGTDNHINNLRLVTSHENNLNLGRRSDCKHVTGVFFATKEKKWRACIGFKNERIYLGDFKNKNDAVIARKSAETRLGFIGDR